MKKLLITSTALVASAGVAFADGHTGLSVSGYAEMGISYVEDRGVNEDDEFLFHSDYDVFFKGSGETDGGISFGFSIDLDEVNNGIGSRGSDGSVFISGNFGTLTLGDTDDAFDKALQEVGALTALTDDHTTHAGFSFNGGGNSAGLFAGLEGLTSGLGGLEEEFVLRYDYSFDALTLSLSIEQGTGFTGTTTFTILSTTFATITSGEQIDDTFSVGVSYDADLGGFGVGLGLGYSDNSDLGTAYGASVAFEVDALEVVLNYTNTELDDDFGDVDWNHYGIGVTYTIDALSLHANYGVFDIDASGVDEITGFGLAANYDLGGGAVVMFGYGSSDFGDNAIEDTSTASFGLGLSF
ncbi:MAG: porin [Pseudomonadota bacterium]